MYKSNELFCFVFIFLSTLPTVYLRTNAEHFQWGWHIDVGRNFHMAKVNGERFAPYTEVSNVKNGYITGQRQNYRFLFIAL